MNWILAGGNALKSLGLKAYPGFDHGMRSTHKDQINTDLLAFIKS